MKHIVFGVCLTALQLVSAAPGHAQRNDQSTGAEADEGSFGQIIVTARRQSESILDVPDTIQAFSSDQIEQADVRSINNLHELVPNFQIVEAQQPGVALINIRGIGQARNGEAPIAVIVDGVQQNSSYQITQDLFDVERIEVLKGPQGSLYGRNAIGGAVNIVTRAPGDEFEGMAEATYASGDEIRARASLSLPLTDSVGFRVSGSYINRDGQIENSTLGENVDFNENTSVRAVLHAEPSPFVTIDLRGSYSDQKAGASYYVSGLANAPRDPVVGNLLGVATRELADLSLRAEFDLGGTTLTSVSAYSWLQSGLFEELDWVELDLLAATQNLDNKAFSQEVRLSSDNDAARLRWTLGLYYLHINRDLDTAIFLQPDLSGVGVPIPLPPTLSTDSNDAYAAFGQLVYDVTDEIELTLGLRYDIDDRNQVDRNPLVPGAPAEFDASFNSLQPKVSLAYSFPNDSLIYMTVAKGFRSGGFNANDVVTRQYGAEELWNYEAGFKAVMANRSVILNGAIFYTEISDRQYYGLDLSAGPNQFIANPIPESHIWGLEVELLAQPMDGLNLSVAGGLLDSKIDTYDLSVFANTLANGDFTGNELNQTPGYTLNAAAQYAFALGSGELLTRFSVSGSGGDYYWEINNEDRRKAVWTADARMTYTFGNISLTAFVNNLFNERHDIEFVPFEFSAVITGADIGAAVSESWGPRIMRLDGSVCYCLSSSMA